MDLNEFFAGFGRERWDLQFESFFEKAKAGATNEAFQLAVRRLDSLIQKAEQWLQATPAFDPAPIAILRGSEKNPKCYLGFDRESNSIVTWELKKATGVWEKIRLLDEPVDRRIVLVVLQLPGYLEHVDKAVRDFTSFARDAGDAVQRALEKVI